MIIAKKGEQFEISLNSRQKYFGVKNFNIKKMNLEDENDVETLLVAAKELIEPVENPASATVVEAADKGQKTIKVNVDTNIKDGMVISDENGNMYYVENIDNGVITVKKPLVEDIDYNSSLKQVGNTGIYKIPLTIDKVSEYNIVISNPEINLRNLIAHVQVVEYNIKDVYTQVDEKFNEVFSKLDTILKSIGQTDNTDFEVI